MFIILNISTFYYCTLSWTSDRERIRICCFWAPTGALYRYRYKCYYKTHCFTIVCFSKRQCCASVMFIPDTNPKFFLFILDPRSRLQDPKTYMKKGCKIKPSFFLLLTISGSSLNCMYNGKCTVSRFRIHHIKNGYYQLRTNNSHKLIHVCEVFA
jgi:hypothetical protein